MAVLLTACHSDDKEEGGSSAEDCYLDIYVYAPDRPIVTRSDVGNIAQRSAAESRVNTLQIWAFKHSNGEKVGYLGTGTGDASDVPNPVFLNETGQQVYRMKVSKSFADAPEAVDVYVVANAASYVTTSNGTAMTLGMSSTRDDLNEAMIGTNSFGTSTLISAVPDNGLPMSAVAKNQSIYGTFPALRIGSGDNMTTLRLTRAVSKLRFILCRITETESTVKKLKSIDAISLNGNQIPTRSYLIPRERYSYTYIADPINYGSVEKNEIYEVANPMVYVYETQKAQDYEDLINAASDATTVETEKAANLAKLTDQFGITGLTVADLPQLKEIGLTYLRESDKKLEGTINYTYENDAEDKTEEISFSMYNPGDFLRNHSWIIYVYYMDSKIYILTVTHIGMKKWTDDGRSEDTSFYNW